MARHSTGTANAIAVDSNTGNVYVTGQGQGAGTGTDFTTIAYSQDTTPPVTTASASPGPNSNGWNNTNVTVTMNSTDSETGGSGVKQIQYTLSGAQSINTQTVPGSTASALISAEGMTTLTYLGTDNAGNAEQSKALTVQIDKTPPVVSGMPATGCALWPPNGRMVQVGTVMAADALSGVAPGSFQMTGSRLRRSAAGCAAGFRNRPDLHPERDGHRLGGEYRHIDGSLQCAAQRKRGQGPLTGVSDRAE